MLNKFLMVVLPIALPFLVYFLYVSIARLSGSGQTGSASLADAPWPWLALTGIILMAAALIGWRVLSDPAAPGTRIEQPRYIDGEVVPSRRLDDDDDARSLLERLDPPIEPQDDQPIGPRD